MDRSVSPLTLDPFCLRQFTDPTYCGTKITDISAVNFLDKINELYMSGHEKGETILHEGYAPFCKHLFVKNFTPATSATVFLTQDLRRFIQSDYEARQNDELPVLTRWISRTDYLAYTQQESLPPAEYLDIILYSHGQLKKEATSRGQEFLQITSESQPERPSSQLRRNEDQDYAIISIKAQDEPYETPMQPITLLRNCLIEEGGSGVALDRAMYLQSVAFWKEHCLLR